MCIVVHQIVMYMYVWVCSTGMHGNVVSEIDQFMSVTVALQLDLSCDSIKHTRNISDSREVIQYAERPYMTCSFQVIHVSMHKTLNWKKTAMCVWSHNSPIVSHMQL